VLGHLVPVDGGKELAKAYTHCFKMEIVAAGVESEEQAKCLAPMGCEQIQGSIISMPKAFDENHFVLQRRSCRYRLCGTYGLTELLAALAISMFIARSAGDSQSTDCRPERAL
jgi:hypothetical protein